MLFGTTLVVGLLAALALPASGQPYPAGYALSRLMPEHGGDGSDGFVMRGVSAEDYTGIAVSNAGDVNGDGIDDLIVGKGMYSWSYSGIDGAAYVIYGRDSGIGGTFPAVFELATLLPANGGDGSVGSVIPGFDAGDYFAKSVSGGFDLNGDDVADLVIGAPRTQIGGRVHTGLSYVVFGSDQGLPAVVNPTALTGINGFVIDGHMNYDNAGWSVSGAGDINNDGFDDVVIGAPFADPNGNASGKSYVVFGSDAPFPSWLRLHELDGDNGFALHGVEQGDGTSDRSGYSVSGAGDVNDDGIDDLVIAAAYADPNGVIDAGECYVVFGRETGFPAVFELSSVDGSNGFLIHGIEAGDSTGFSVSAAGDVNGDSIGDIIIGAAFADPGGRDRAGKSFVVFGTDQGFPAEIELSSLDGMTGFAIHGIEVFDFSGYSVSGAGDVNGDGFDDLLVGAWLAGLNSTGAAYVIYGSDEPFAAVVDPAALSGINGFMIQGADDIDSAGRSVSGAGDVNHDGFDDVLIGAPWAGDDNSLRGDVYLLYGRSEFSLIGLPESLAIDTSSDTGSLSVDGLTAAHVPNLQVEAFGLTKKTTRVLSITGETGVVDPYDQPEGVGVALFDVPEDTEAFVVDVISLEAPDIDIVVGRDDNGDGEISPDEQECAAGKAGSVEHCEVHAPQPGSWWVAVINYTASAPDATDDSTVYAASIGASSGSFTATSPAGTIGAPSPIALDLSWTLEDAQACDMYAGLIRFGSDVGSGGELGSCVVSVTRTGADTDTDGLFDCSDNCINAPNADQRDTNGDGFGNMCDADLNNDCIVNTEDLGLFKAVYFTSDVDADFNGDGIVNVVDLGLLKTMYFLPPGPSGLINVCDGS